MLTEVVQVPSSLGDTHCEIFYSETFSMDADGRVKNARKVPRGYVLLLHGLGDCVDMWKTSKMAESLVAQGFEAVAFDWYGHGLSADAVQLFHHESTVIDVFSNQLREVMFYHEFRFKDRIVNINGFSMGGYIALKYIAKYAEGGEYFGQRMPFTKICLQSCWNGQVPLFARTLSLVPLSTALLRFRSFKHCHDTDTLYAIIFRMGQGKAAWIASVAAFASVAVHSGGVLVLSDAERFYQDISSELFAAMEALTPSPGCVISKEVCPLAGEHYTASTTDGPLAKWFRRRSVPFHTSLVDL